MKTYRFKTPLIEGVIKSRPNRFIMLVQLQNKKIFRCHCPSTGRIGNVNFENVPCLLSKGENPDRITPYTVEAISLDTTEKKKKQWIGINQTKINSYVEFFIKAGEFPKMIEKSSELKREVKLHDSRIDFLVGKIYLEVKMPLITLPDSENFLSEKEHSKFNSFDRLIKHFADLSKNKLNSDSRAIVMLCYMYAAEPFKPPAINKSNVKIQNAAKSASKSGVEHWQANFRIDKKGVSLLGYSKLSLF